ncbi:MAG: FecR domain-containing protein [Gammaproteobacteria bacterium]|nr:FecR domain-containing protein [Gammaproteobacteria bacterium]
MRLASLAFVVLTGLTSGLAEARVGEVLFVRGPVTAQGEAEAFPRFLGRGDEVKRGDVITTSNNGYVAVRFIDDGKVTLRPGTAFKVEEYVHDLEGNESSALLRLFKGGLRTLTGLIGKSRPESYRLRTPVATIGIRGTRYDARLCEAGECQTAESAADAGRVAFLSGQVFAVRSGRREALGRRARLYEGDVVETSSDSVAVLVFRDDTRVTLQSESRFVVEQYQYREQEPEKSSLLFRFVRGGLRVLTGLVARDNRERFRVATPVATIGIRGTGFDGICKGKCFTSEGEPAGQSDTEDGMFFDVWEGGIVLDQNGKKSEVKEGETFFAKSVFTPPIQVPGLPKDLQQKQGPRPDKPEFGRKQVFGKDNGETGDKAPSKKKDKEAELFVKVDEGAVTLETEDGQLEVSAGEAAHAAPGAPPQTIPQDQLPVDFMQNVPLPDADPNARKNMEPCQIR